MDLENQNACYPLLSSEMHSMKIIVIYDELLQPNTLKGDGDIG